MEWGSAPLGSHAAMKPTVIRVNVPALF